MNKIISTIAALGLALSLAACNSDPETAPEQPTATVTKTVEPESEPLDRDAMYLNLVRDEYPDLAYIPDADIIGLAKSACGALDRGASGDDVARLILDNISPSERESIAFTVGAGVGVYCPEHVDEFGAGTNS